MENEVVHKLTRYAREFVYHGGVYNRKERKRLALEFIHNAKKKSITSEAPITAIEPSVVLTNRVIELLNLALTSHIKNCIIVNAMAYNHHKFKTLDDVVWYLYNIPESSVYLASSFEFIDNSFDWNSTEEGHFFWHKIYNMVSKFLKELDYKTI